MEENKTNNKQTITFDMIASHPEKYIEIHILKKHRMVEVFHIYATDDKFKYGEGKEEMTYNVKADCIYLFPKKKGLIMPSSFYYYNNANPISFKNENKGIPANALTLLWNPRLFAPLVQPDDSIINLILIGLIIGQMIFLAISDYFLLGGTL